MNKITYNSFWNKKTSSVFTIVTTIYNRVDYLIRPLESVKNQSFRDFEYVIVDDGSEESPDAIVEKYMEDVDFPVLYIKKENGGAHSARNVGVSKARGKYIAILDSDDEFLPNALAIYNEVWESISPDTFDQYREVVARDCDEKGNILSCEYPKGINLLPKEKAEILAQGTGEHISVNRADILKNNPFPEPKGVKFVDESISWRILNQKYRSFYINDVVYKYYRDIPDSLTHSIGKKKNIQHCINFLWNFGYQFYNRKKLKLNLKYSIKCCLLYLMFYDVLKFRKSIPQYKWLCEFKSSNVSDLIFLVILKFPSFILAIIYNKKRMI